MSFRYRDEESSAAGALYVALGALAGFAAGVVVSQQYGGISGLTSRIRERFSGGDTDTIEAEDETEYDYEYESEDETPLTLTEQLEERVLEAFRNDPVLNERAIDIGAIDDGIVELSGWVNSEDESRQAVAVTRGVPGVETVVNRLALRAEEQLLEEQAERYGDGDPALTEARWEGQQVGTGRRRQGTSDEPDRHSDPRVELAETALENGTQLEAEEVHEARAERKQRDVRRARGGRTDGSPVAPTGVPKGDHVADPLNAPSDVPERANTQRDPDKGGTTGTSD